METHTRRDFLRASVCAGVTSEIGRVLSPLLADSSPAPLPAIDSLMRDYMRRYTVPGASLAFMRGEQLLYAAAYGVACKSPKADVTDASLFRIASNSKAFTSAAIFTLIESRRLTLTDRVFGAKGILNQFSTKVSYQEWLESVHDSSSPYAHGWRFGETTGTTPCFWCRSVAHSHHSRLHHYQFVSLKLMIARRQPALISTDPSAATVSLRRSRAESRVKFSQPEFSMSAWAIFRLLRPMKPGREQGRRISQLYSIDRTVCGGKTQRTNGVTQ